jgi:hypothetical protein
MSTRGRVSVVVLGLAIAGGPACGVSGGTSSSPSGAAGSTSGPGTAGAGSAGSGTAGESSAAGAGAGTAGNTATGAAGAAGAAGGGGTADATDAGAGTAGAGGTAPLSGITVNIGGTSVPKENVIAFINFGHSNMAGRGVSPAATRPYFFGAPDPHAWMYHSGRGFEPAVEPNTAGDGGNMVNGMVSGGPSTALVKEAVALAPDKYFVTIPTGQGSAYCSQFLPGALYYNDVITGAKELKGKVTFAAIVVMLGITERHGTQADIDNYPQCINKLVTQIRTDIGEPNLPLLINDYEMGTTGPLAPVPSDAFYEAIRPKILMIPSVVSNAVVIPTDNPIIQIEIDTSTNDEHHFSLDGHKEYVRRVLQTMMDKGWAAW